MFYTKNKSKTTHDAFANKFNHKKTIRDDNTRLKNINTKINSIVKVDITDFNNNNNSEEINSNTDNTDNTDNTGHNNTGSPKPEFPFYSCIFGVLLVGVLIKTIFF